MANANRRKRDLRLRYGSDPLNYNSGDGAAQMAAIPAEVGRPAVATALAVIGWIEMAAALILGFQSSLSSVWAASAFVGGLILIGLAKIIELLAIIARK